MNQKIYRPRTVSGKKVLLVSVLMCLHGTLAAVVLSLWWVQSRPRPAAELVWAERAAWPSSRVQWVSLDTDGHTPPFERRYRTPIRPNLPPPERKFIAMLAQAARESRGREAAAGKRHFYSHYLGGQYEKAIALAPKVLTFRFMDQGGRSVVGLAIGTVEIAFAQWQAGQLDDSLRLVFPDLVTDARGQIYLPVYDSECRATDLPQPPEIQIKYPPDYWFTFPGRIGALPSAVVVGPRQR